SLLACAGGRGVTDAAVLRHDFGARRRMRNTVDDDPIIWRKPGPDHTQSAPDIADLDLLGYNRAVRPDGHDGVLRLVWEHGCVRHQQRLYWRANDQPHASELARRQEVIGIGDGGAGMDRAARSELLRGDLHFCRSIFYCTWVVQGTAVVAPHKP